MSMKYDNTGRLVSQTYPSGRILSYLRDSAGSVTGLKVDAPNGSSTLLASDITYAPDGPLTHITYGNGLSEDRTYDLSYQVQSITVGNVLKRSYAYSTDGNIINAKDELNPVYSDTVSYDAIDRMVQSSGWYGVYSFTYDANGNRTSVTRSGTKDTYSISTSNNYLTKTSVAAASYTYDASGNIVKRGSDVFAYNGYSQLTGATVNGTTAQYLYNGQGQRAVKTISGQTTLYFYDNDGHLLSEANASTGAITREYVWLGNKPVAYLFGDKGYYVHTDNTDTPQLLTDNQGNVVWTIQTYPFGKQTFSGSVTFNLRYPGQYFDEETGLHYNWHRYYDPNTGRYITSDPIGLAGELNNAARWSQSKNTYQ